MRKIVSFIIIFLIPFFLSSGCGKNPTGTIGDIPEVITSNVSQITDKKARCAGFITSDGGLTITANGICWSTNLNPTLANNTTNENIGDTWFQSDITGLTPKTTYYVKAYATNSAGTGYGSTLSFTTDDTLKTGTVTDIDGNIYKTVRIGDQWWMAENLKVTHYQNGDPIPNVIDKTEWINLNTGAYCSYLNDENNATTYGMLYNWFAIDDTRNIAPEGWRVPYNEEWQDLVYYLGGDSIAGGKLKEIGITHWRDPNTGATDEFGFCALPGGYCSNTGNFIGFRRLASLWASGTYERKHCWFLYDDVSDISSNPVQTNYFGSSVRCIRK